MAMSNKFNQYYYEFSVQKKPKISALFGRAVIMDGTSFDSCSSSILNALGGRGALARHRDRLIVLLLATVFFHNYTTKHTNRFRRRLKRTKGQSVHQSICVFGCSI